jgi:23S rRNA (pseudouridine1915-N3)-methyltransferase
MLKITVIAVGKLKERFWRDACAEYLKRLDGYCKITVREIPDSNINQEAALILDALPEKAPVIVLDIQGKPMASEKLASTIERYTVEGISHIVFVIGGSDGLTPEVKAKAALRMSFGPLTLPHNLARVLLLEQIYRAFKIIRHEPYHK